MRMRHIVICCQFGCTIFFPHYLINGTIFGGGGYWTWNVFWLNLQLLSETFLILRRTDMIKKVYCSSCKVSVIHVRLRWNFKFLDRFSKNTQIPNFMKIRPVRAKLFPAGGQTEVTKHIRALKLTRYNCVSQDRIPAFLARPPPPLSLLPNGHQRLFSVGKTSGAWSWPLSSIRYRG